MVDFFVQAFITLLVIINPFAVVPIFASLTKHDSFDIKKTVAKRSCLISIALLLLFAIIGDFLLGAMKISEAAFRITGGFLLLLSAIDMVRSKSDYTMSQNESCAQKTMTHVNDICVFPLAIPFLAGPGAITSTVVLMRHAEHIDMMAQLGLIFILIFVIALTYLCLLASDRILKKVGVTGTNVLTRVFGIVLSALCIQGIINGIKEAFPLYIS